MAKKKKKNQQGESKALKTENDKISVGEIESSSIVFRLKIWPEKEFLKASQPSKLIKEALDSEYKMGIANKEGLRFTKVDFLSGNEFEVGVDIRDAGGKHRVSNSLLSVSIDSICYNKTFLIPTFFLKIFCMF